MLILTSWNSNFPIEMFGWEIKSKLEDILWLDLMKVKKKNNNNWMILRHTATSLPWGYTSHMDQNISQLLQSGLK